MIDVEKQIEEVMELVQELINAQSSSQRIREKKALEVKLRTLLSSAQSGEQEVGKAQLVAMVVEGRARINDMLQNDDGQAYKEARKYIERTDRFFAASQPNGEAA
jgi:hypothetical protein